MPAAEQSYPLEQLEPTAPPPPPGSPARLLAIAREEAERIRASAREEGHSEGLRAGREEGIAEARAAAHALQAALGALRGEREALYERIERDAVELAFSLTEKVLAGVLELQPERVLDAVTGALRRLADRRRVVIVVDPADLETVRAALGELQANAGGIEECELQADRRVGRGGAIVRTHESEVDASVATQLERAREVVCEELGEESSVSEEASVPMEPSAEASGAIEESA